MNQCFSVNQCDGCRVKAPFNAWGHHKYADGSLIACTKARYEVDSSHLLINEKSKESENELA
jgi:hypothetical protein